jgi:hypothetical protein
MGVEQTDFLHIFDETEAAKKLDLSNSPVEMIDNEEVKPVKENKLNEKPEYLVSESLITKEEKIKKEAEIKLKRLRLLQTNRDISLAEFEDIMPEIKAYGIRLLMLRAAYDKAAPGEEKQKAYLKLVSPDIHDDKAHHDSARLYLKYLEAVKVNKKQRVFLNKKESKKKQDDTSSLDRKIRKLENYKPGYKDVAARNFE